MASIFDQHQPKSTLARSLNEAFMGCDKWSIAPPRRRTGDAIPAPRATAFAPQALEAPVWTQPQR